MKSPNPLKHFIFAFAIALALYVTLYTGIERRRARNGPWRVTFTSEAGVPGMIINEPKLGIANLRIEFPSEPPTPTNSIMVFDQPQPWPFATPFGECIFMDTTFLPGTIVLKSFGHEIQLLPRILTIDKKEYPWQSDSVIKLNHVSGPAVSTNAS